MLFNSIHFMWFFPLVVIAYFCLPHKLRWVWLLVASYYFYMAWSVKYVFLIAFSTLVTYLSGLFIERAGGVGQKKLVVAFSFVINLGILFFFKYFSFALGNLNRILALVGMHALDPAFDVLLPVGISFYTFQALSYTVDVYRGEIKAEKSLGKYALFVSFFPGLVAGPIERSKHLLGQMYERHDFDATQAKDGLLLMMWGFFQKMVVADRAALVVNEVFASYSALSGLQVAFGVVLYAVQIYCDFAGYSNIAIGAAQVMGFRLMENFRMPYFARSVREFWRRWHISLSTWFRDYLYIPLGGSRCSKPRKYFNTMVTFLASGLWHGASWNFVAWGGLHGGYQVLGDMLAPLKAKLKQKLGIRNEAWYVKLAQGLATFALVCFAWIFFRAQGAAQALDIIRVMFSRFSLSGLFNWSTYLLGVDSASLMILLLAVGVLLAADVLQGRMHVRRALAAQKAPVRFALYYGAVFVLIFLGITGSSEQFLYFRF